MAHDTLHRAAVAYLLAHQGQHLSCDRALLANRCIQHLQHHHATTRVVAEVAALQALGDLASRATGVHVDLDKTTSYAVFLVDPASGKRVCFTATDLLRLSRDHDFHASLAARRAASH